jgi:hypothetical protein
MRGRLNIPKGVWTYRGPAVATNAATDIVLFVRLAELSRRKLFKAFRWRISAQGESGGASWDFKFDIVTEQRGNAFRLGSLPISARSFRAMSLFCFCLIVYSSK